MAAVLHDHQVIDRRRALTRAHRPPLGDRLERIYIVALGGAIYGSMLFSGLSHVQVGRTCATSETCIEPSAGPVFAWGLALLLTGAAGALTSALGPMSASAGEASWWFSTPMDRLQVLRPALARTTAVLAMVAGAIGWFVWHAASGETGVDSQMIAWSIGGAILGAGVASLASLAQAHAPWNLVWRKVPAVLIGAGFVCCLAALTRTQLGSDAIAAPAPGWVALLAITAVVVALLATSAHGLRHIPSSRLRQGGRLQESLSTSAVALDLGHASRQIAADRGARRGRGRTIAGRAEGGTALMMRDVLTLLRRRGFWAGVLVTTIGPSLVLVLLGSRPALIVMVLMSASVARSAAVGLTTLTRSPGLARAFPLPTHTIRTALLMAPLLAALAWVTPVALLTATGPAVAISVALAGVAGACRAAGGPPVGVTGPLVITSSGVLPLGMLTQLLRGVDVTLLCAAPLVFGVGAPLGIAVAVVVIVLHVARPAHGWLATPLPGAAMAQRTA